MLNNHRQVFCIFVSFVMLLLCNSLKSAVKQCNFKNFNMDFTIGTEFTEDLGPVDGRTCQVCVVSLNAHNAFTCMDMCVILLIQLVYTIITC